MTREETIKILEDGEWWNNLDELYETVNPTELQELHDAVDMALSALRAQAEAEKNEPLTVEEVQQLTMKDWLWVEVIGGKPRADFGRWNVNSAYYQVNADYSRGEALCCGYPGIGFEFEYADYGKTWLAYRRKPEEGAT